MSTLSGPRENVCGMAWEKCAKPAGPDDYCDEHAYYFPNGTAWDIWSSEWCDRCVRDHWERVSPGCGKGCPLILKSIHHERIPEWMYMDNAEGEWPKLVCINFKGYGEGGGEPKPQPVPPGQGQMFEPPCGPRMLSPLEAETKVQVNA
jgi:hypothetical protein